MTIWFDMDGTIADLYGVDGWLDYLLAEDTTPYAEAATLVNMNLLARYLNKAQRNGVQIGVISWTSKGGSADYNEAVAAVKRKWLAKHLKSVHWDSIVIAPYGWNKAQVKTNDTDILFDDEAHNRDNWGQGAHNVHNILEILRKV